MLYHVEFTVQYFASV